MLSLSSSNPEDKTCLREDSSVQLPSVIQVEEKSTTSTAHACENKIKPREEKCSANNSTTISASKRQQLSEGKMERSSHAESKQSSTPTIESRLRQAERFACSSIEIGNSTSAKLREQGDHLRLISNTVDETEYELKKSHRIVRGISSWVGAIKNLFTRSPKPPNSYTCQNTLSEKSSSPSITERNENKLTSKCRSDNSNICTCSNNNSKEFKQSNCQCTEYCKEKNDDKEQQYKSQEQEITHSRHEENKLIDLLHEDVQRLREQALSHNEMLSQQNECLEKLKQKNEVVRAKLDKTQRNIKDLLE